MKIAWINNCVGHYNQRYFLLMIFHVLLGTGSFVLTGMPLYTDSRYSVRNFSDLKKSNIFQGFTCSQIWNIHNCLYYLLCNAFDHDPF